MVDKKQDLSLASYTLGILSIVFAFFTPIAGLILGIIGFRVSGKKKLPLSKKAKKLNVIGIVLSIIFVIASILAITLFSDLLSQI
jgi:MFS family permease